jgi:hypothetical protein
MRDDMSDNPEQEILKPSFASRYVIPSGIGVSVFFVLFFTYYASWYVENRLLHFLLTDVVGAIYGFYLLFNVLMLYPILYFKNASLPERISGSSLVVLCWLTKEVIRMTEFYSIPESVFYLLMPVQANICLLAIGFMAASELICRKIERKRKNPDICVLTPVPVLFLIFSLFGVAFIIRGGGVKYFFNFYDLYKIIFL